jgi:LuxR family maltose regulon positive regulatory protein
MSKARAQTEPSDEDGLQKAASSPQEQLVEHLARMQQEYRQFQSWLKEMGLQLSRREAEVTRHLHEAMASLSNPQPPSASKPASAPSPNPAAGTFSLYVQVLGKSVVRCQNRVVSLGSNKKGRALFRYLITLPERRAAKDVLLELFWPNDDPHEASHKLHIAVSTLRQALDASLQMPQDGESVLFVDDHYALSPDLYVQLDADVFAAHVQTGERLEREGKASEAMVEYEAARALYGGDFLVEDLYADWTIARRARLEELYLTLLGRLARHYLDEERYAESVSCCRQILARDSFREDAYRHLMRCYSRMGRRNQALREYQACQEVLKRELGVSPMRETVALYEQIAREET